MDSTVERILKAAKAKKMNQKELAAQIGIHAQVITDWKNGSTSYQRYIQKISELLSVSVDYLLTGQEAAQIAPAGDPEMMAFMAALGEFTPEERERIKGYIEGLRAQRK